MEGGKGQEFVQECKSSEERLNAQGRVHSQRGEEWQIFLILGHGEKLQPQCILRGKKKKKNTKRNIGQAAAAVIG